MPHIPGTHRNGQHDPQIPPNLVWDEDNPPILFECSGDVSHTPICAGNCDSVIATELQVELINEHREWQRLGMSPEVITTTHPFDNECRIGILLEMIQELADISDEELNIKFMEKKLNRMTSIRQNVEPSVKEARLKMQLGIAQSRLLGPNGEILGG